jgi:signal transduction histidine kinase
VIREEAELRNRLLETVNHELRTPVTKLLGHAELLDDRRDDLPAFAHGSIDAMLRGGRDLAQLLRTVSELADLEAAMSPTKTYGNVVTRVKAVVDELDRTAERRTVRTETSLPDRLTATLDLGLVRSAVKALLDNALTYAPPGTTVHVAATVEGASLVLEVADTGPGIPEDDRERLLHPFEVGTNPGQPVNSRGLGLALANVVAVAHGGRLALTDNAPRGLRARLVLPRYGAPVLPQQPTAATRSATAAPAQMPAGR